jgi:hypothetical protein
MKQPRAFTLGFVPLCIAVLGTKHQGIGWGSA